MTKDVMWLFISSANRKDIHLAIPTIAWMAKDAGVAFECYLECERDGTLFAETGSTILGGRHHQQFNYLNSIFDVKYIILGETSVFRSSINIFEAEILAESEYLEEIYKALMAMPGVMNPDSVLYSSDGIIDINGGKLEIGSYLFPEIYYRRAMAMPVAEADKTLSMLTELEIENRYCIFLNNTEKQKLDALISDVKEIDCIYQGDRYSTITMRIAERWKHKVKALAFGDPAAILSQLASLCREERIAVYGEKEPINQADVVVTAYSEQKTEIAEDVIRLCEELGNRVIVGRQTGDGDLFAWAKGGVCIQIMDPNRPAFPVVATIPHIWIKSDICLFDMEPDDDTLLEYAKSGKILATLMWHSGEMAHNEAMINLIDLVSFTGIRMGIGVHAARYETCPQLWELINIPKEKGGVKGYIEPIIHSGGMGVMAEINCPPNFLRQHCETALGKIRKLAGDEATPRGYYAFADTDLDTLMTIKPEIYEAVEKSGLEYFISSVKPGRNRIIYETENMIVLNQSSRTQCSGSPFVRITTIEDINESGYQARPGWFIGTLDSPVISFNPYIWRHGARFMQIVDWIRNAKDVVNVTPHTIARYARILKQEGFLS